MKKMSNIDIAEMASKSATESDVDKISGLNFLYDGDSFIMLAQKLNPDGTVNTKEGSGLVDYGYCVGYTDSEVKDCVCMRYVSYQYYPPKPMILVMTPIEVLLGKKNGSDGVLFRIINMKQFINLMSKTNNEINQFTKFAEEQPNNPEILTI